MEDHNAFFKYGSYEEYYPDQMDERPNEEITLTIRLNQTNISYAELSKLSTELSNSQNMDLTRSSSDRDIVTVSGIPSDKKFDEHEVMKVVRAYAPRAKVIPK